MTSWYWTPERLSQRNARKPGFEGRKEYGRSKNSEAKMLHWVDGTCGQDFHPFLCKHHYFIILYNC